MIQATSPYLNRPLRTEAQAKADLASRLRAVHMANATHRRRLAPFDPVHAAATLAQTVAYIAAIAFLVACLGLGVVLLSGILAF